MSLAQGNNTPTRPRIEPGSPDPESDALTTRPVRSPYIYMVYLNNICKWEGGSRGGGTYLKIEKGDDPFLSFDRK